MSPPRPFANPYFCIAEAFHDPFALRTAALSPRTVALSEQRTDGLRLPTYSATCKQSSDRMSQDRTRLFVATAISTRRASSH
jgi:hypothetical protein